MKTLVRLLPAVLSFLLLSFELALAGAPPLQWQKTFGGSNHDYGSSVQQTSDGGYIIAGDTKSYGVGYYNVYLIKTDSAGNIQWQKTSGGTGYQLGFSVQQTTDGRYIIAGSGSCYYYGDPNVYLMKTDSNGNIQWEQTFGGSNNDTGSSVQQTTDGGYIIAGCTYSYGKGYCSVYLIKTDPNGNIQWQKTSGTLWEDEGYSVQQTSDGGYIIAGATRIGYVPGAQVGDVCLIKTDPNGDSKWQKTFGGSNWDAGYSVQQTFDGGYIIAGSTSSYSAGDFDVYLIKTDSSGNPEWEQTFGGSDNDRGRSVQQTTDGGYIIAGETSSYGAGSDDVYLIKTDPNGNSEWQRTFGGLDFDWASSVQQTSDGGYIIAGLTSSFGAGSRDVYLIKLCSDGILSADLNCNGTVYFADLKILVDQWLQPPDILSADIAPELGDGIVNFLDFRILAQDWLETTTP